jgi:hypothetical protein
MTDYAKLESAFTAAAITAIKKMGLPAFKATPFFASNERVLSMPKAA